MPTASSIHRFPGARTLIKIEVLAMIQWLEKFEIEIYLILTVKNRRQKNFHPNFVSKFSPTKKKSTRSGRSPGSGMPTSTPWPRAPTSSKWPCDKVSTTIMSSHQTCAVCPAPPQAFRPTPTTGSRGPKSQLSCWKRRHCWSCSTGRIGWRAAKSRTTMLWWK